MDAGDLSIAAVHRLLRGMPAFDAAALLARAGECFLVTPLRQGTTESLLAPLGRRQGPALVVVTPAGAWLLAARPEAIARELAGCAERLRRLEVVLLHALILERLLGIGPASAGGRAQVVLERDPAQAVEQVRSGGAEAAFLLPPVGLRDLREVAFAGDVLPRGSTAFYPPLLEGLTIYAQD
jgi:hypothetical protein